MEFLTQLWLPILLSTAAVFVAGFIINTVLPYHMKDYTRLPDEDAIRTAIQAQNLTPALYSFPFAQSNEEWKSTEVREKFRTGPIGFLTVGRPGTAMDWKQFLRHAIYVLCVSFIVAYVAYAALGAGDQEYLTVFQVTGAAATLAYSAALFTNSIWFHMPWGNTLRHAFDGLVYGLLTAGFFGWLW